MDERSAVNDSISWDKSRDVFSWIRRFTTSHMVVVNAIENGLTKIISKEWVNLERWRKESYKYSIVTLSLIYVQVNRGCAHRYSKMLRSTSFSVSYIGRDKFMQSGRAYRLLWSAFTVEANCYVDIRRRTQLRHQILITINCWTSMFILPSNVAYDFYAMRWFFNRNYENTAENAIGSKL